MFKKILLAALGWFGIAYAQGFYIGVGGGYDSTDFSKALNIVNTDTGSIIYDKKDNLNGNGFFGTAVFGYGIDVGRMFFAAELDGNLSTLRYHGWYVDNTANESSTGTFTINESYGASFIPGVYLNKNIAVYGRIGIERGNFHYEEYKNDSGASSGLAENQWLNGLRLGAGLAVPLSKHTALRFEYDHIQYNTFSNNTFPMPAGQVRTINLTPQDNQIQLMFIYNFS